MGDLELYKASELDFSDSHKLFKRCLRTFSWEVLEVYSGPPVVAFKWAHWGTMTGDLSDKLGENKKLEAHATNEVVMVYGVTVAKVNEKFQIEELQTFYDPNDIMVQMTKNLKEGYSKDDLKPSGKCPFNPQ
jgi:hypothetical protein